MVIGRVGIDTFGCAKFNDAGSKCSHSRAVMTIDRPPKPEKLWRLDRWQTTALGGYGWSGFEGEKTYGNSTIKIWRNYDD